MQMPPDEKTKKFQQAVKSLIEKGIVKTRQEIVDVLKWNKVSMSAVMNSRESVPDYIWAELRKVYPEAQPTDWRDEQVAFYREQVEYYREANKKMEGEIIRLHRIIDDALSSFEKKVELLAENQFGLLAAMGAYQEYWLKFFHADDPGKVEEVKRVAGIAFAEKLKSLKQQGSAVSSL